MKRGLYLAGGALALGGTAGLAFYLWEWFMDTRSNRISNLLAAQLPAHLGKWAGPIAYGAARTAPSDFPTADGDAAMAWAKFGAAVMDRESQGGIGDGYSPAGEWNGEGDGGHAVTPWQLDKRFHAKYLARTDRTPESDSLYAFVLLRDRWNQARDHTDNPELARASTAAAYNASASKVWAALDSGGGFSAVDALTTGGDYGSDVLRRAAELGA